MRKLDQIEAAMAWRHARLNGTSQATNVLTLEGLLAPEMVQAAFDKVCASQEALRMRLVQVKGVLCFEEGGIRPPGNFSRLTLGSGRIDALVEVEVNTVLDAGMGLWRHALIHDEERTLTHVLVTRHHAVTDGHTGEQLLASFLRHLDADLQPPLPPRSLSPGPEAYLLRAGRGPEPGALPVGEDSQLWLAHFVEAPPASRTTGIVSRVLDPLALSRVTEHCKAAEISVHSAITTAFAGAFADIANREAFNLFTAVSLRKSLSSGRPIDDFGCFVGVRRSAFQGQLSLVEAARAYAADIEGAAERIRAEARDQSQVRQTVESLAGANRFRGVIVSNTGSLHALRQSTPRRIIDYWAVSNRNAGFFAAGLHFTFVNGVRMTVNYTRPSTPDVLAEALLEETISRLETLATRGWGEPTPHVERQGTTPPRTAHR